MTATYRALTAPGHAGVRVAVTREPRPVAGVDVTATAAPEGARYLAPGGAEAEVNLVGALALAAAEARAAPGGVRVDRAGDAWWATPARVEFFNWAQPAFAARVLTLDPRELDSRHFPGVASTGVPFLVVPVERVADVERAEFALWRLRDLMPRVGAVAAVAFAAVPDAAVPRFRMRAFPEALGFDEAAVAGDAAGALAAWLADQDWFRSGGVDAVVDAGVAEAHVRARRDADGRVHVRVGGRVTREDA